MTDHVDDFTVFHDELATVARDALGSVTSTGVIDWMQIAGAGWLGLEIADELEGAGATFAEIAVILREYGRAAAGGPYSAVASAAVGVLTLLEESPNRDDLLRQTAKGEAVPVLVQSGDLPSNAIFELIDGRGQYTLNGSAGFVPDVFLADQFLVPAMLPDGTRVVAEVAKGCSGLSITEQPVVDETRSFGEIIADGVTVPKCSVHRFSGDPDKSMRRVNDRTAVAIACDSIGISEAMLDATVEYACMREQFNRKIGSFQAVKHACADMLVNITIARKLVTRAVDAVCTPEWDEQSAVAASMAKAFATEMAVDIAGKAMQLHGGMGYTWESGIHVYLKRATLNRSQFGSPAAHRKLLGTRYLERGVRASNRDY
ncbi:acyl-CoA dehydrogenase family protein [Rhodococcus sp. B50]|uniref:acyl-CoA dehydrogenase family protein n=1 Tax=Rhodococcus sp. B50 TaxID=2682847 RepID=UPI001BD3A714|nr:acyl-CoA dehydrogenase family protein [Rhodococcus sp. B50]MBS9376105.1 Acyl-CoA dehydrogenase [Rhodococcus sp. B50]